MSRSRSRSRQAQQHQEPHRYSGASHRPPLRLVSQLHRRRPLLRRQHRSDSDPRSLLCTRLLLLLLPFLVLDRLHQHRPARSDRPQQLLLRPQWAESMERAAGRLRRRQQLLRRSAASPPRRQRRRLSPVHRPRDPSLRPPPPQASRVPTLPPNPPSISARAATASCLQPKSIWNNRSPRSCERCSVGCTMHKHR